MDDPDAHVRILAAQSLGEFGARAKLAIPRLLIEVRRDGSVSIAATALSKIDPDSADKAGIARMHPTPSYE
jgi:hypothetical protein